MVFTQKQFITIEIDAYHDWHPPLNVYSGDLSLSFAFTIIVDRSCISVCADCLRVEPAALIWPGVLAVITKKKCVFTPLT